MEVIIKKHTYWNKPLTPGDAIDVEPNIAYRWANKGIAELVVKETKPIEEPINTKEEAPVASEISYTELKKKAKNQGVDGYNKMKKKELIDALDLEG